MLSRDKVVDRTNKCLHIFEHYLNRKIERSTKFLNPLYHDTKPSCNIYMCRTDHIYKLYDHGSREHSGDAFFFVGRLYGVNDRTHFVDVLRIINRDLRLGIAELEYNFNNKYTKMIESKAKFAITPETHAEKRDKPYTMVEQPMKDHELQYWQSYGITPKILERYRVRSLVSFKGTKDDGQEYTLRSNRNEPIFGYVRDKFVKVYRPCSKGRFYHGGVVDENFCFGLEQLPQKGDAVFITGGEKDVMSLAAKGFNAISFGGENNTLPIDAIHSLTHRFKHIILLFDMDETGVESSEKYAKELSTFGVKRLELPLSGEAFEKDISDYFKIGYTRQDFLNLFVTILDSLYSTTMTILKTCEVDFDNPPQITDDIISVSGVPLGTEGNILCVTGGEGTGKSNYIASILAGCIKEESSVIDTLGTTIKRNVMGKAILLYDTEQSEVQLYKNVSKLIRRAKVHNAPPEFKAFCLTSLSRKERMKAIVESMDRYYYKFGGIHLVVIDGVADLVRCANDEAESIAVVDELYRLAGIYKTSIICVLHYIPNGLKLRGHLGSEIQRKAAAILSIERDKEPQISVVKALKVRDGSPLDIPLMQFSWNTKEGMHTYLGEKSVIVKDERKRLELKKIVSDIFADSPPLSYIELTEQIQQLVGVSERTAKSYIKFMRDNELILNDPGNSTLFLEGI
ncbi:MAG: bifunctional DNA primase/helicase [Rikenellaceae bacterium]